VVPIARIDIPEAVRPVSLTLDAGELIEQFTAAGVGYVLHGHQHLPFAGSAAKFNVLPNNGRQWSRRVSRDSLYVLACGSTGAKWEWLPHEVGQNMIAVYIPQTDRLSVTFIQFLPMQSHRIYWKGAVPLRNFHASRSLRH
jgi:hypothetical protein